MVTTYAQRCRLLGGAWGATRERLRFDVMFVGDDWFDTPRWREIEAEFDRVGGKVVYFPYTQGTSSTLINSALEQRRAALESTASPRLDEVLLHPGAR